LSIRQWWNFFAKSGSPVGTVRSFVHPEFFGFRLHEVSKVRFWESNFEKVFALS